MHYKLKKRTAVLCSILLTATFITICYLHYIVTTSVIDNEFLSQDIKLVELYKNMNQDKLQILTKNYKDLFDNKDYAQLATDSIKFLEIRDLLQVNLYNGDGVKLLSNNNLIINIITSRKLQDLNFANMLDSIFFSFYNSTSISDQEDFLIEERSPSDILLKAKIQESNFTLSRSIVPVYSKRGELIVVFEIYHDLTNFFEQSHFYRYCIFLASLALMYLLFVILKLDISEGQDIIAQQQEENKKLMEARIRAETENEEKSKFLANVSHELRTPLNSVIGFSDMIKAETEGPINEVYKTYINDINNSGVHLLSLINDILDYSKASAEKLTVDMVLMDVRKTIVSCIRLVTPRALEAGINLTKNVPEESLVITADPKRLKQCILNLLSNSVKFTPAGGEVNISIAKETDVYGTDLLVINVTDSGIGIAEKDIPKALSVFGQIDNQLNRKYAGTGIGLPFSKKLTELMKGEFRIKSKIGFGTTVSLAFSLQHREGADG